MKFTVRFAHLASRPMLTVGDKVVRGDIVGKMGNSGQSTGAHLHIDVVRGWQNHRYTLEDMDTGIVSPCARELLWFIDDELFNHPYVITTNYADRDYFYHYKKVHHAFDIVPEDRHETQAHYYIHWNRSHPGHVMMVDYDERGYGHYILVGYEV